MNNSDKAARFDSLHKKKNPLVLYNVWDAGSARAVAEAGAQAIATGSWSCAAAQGYADGEQMPFSALLYTVKRIVASVNLPVTVDFETGYGTSLENIQRNLAALLDAGVVGVNFEDQRITQSGLVDIEEQCRRITALREVADKHGTALFINARTDIFLQAASESTHEALIAEAKQRLLAYQAAGANGYFVPGLSQQALIADLCEFSPLPVNIMITSTTPALESLRQLGVSRISHGSLPYIDTMEQLKQRAAGLY
ncbi:phosphonomutase [Ewingella americana]|nr:phosphonomutase [Ewingella americana]